MLSPSQRELVKATVPALREHGEAVTRVFYANMFEAHPELYNIFNPANQRDGGQQRSLAAAVLAYAEHIDNPQVLGKMLERIESKHVSLEVKAEHYPIVGKYLLGAIQEVMGAVATPEILAAWSAAYGQLAGIMSSQEETHYVSSAALRDGWRGFKPFRVERKVRESEVMTSFYLVPADGSPLPPFQAGQFLSIKVHPDGFPYDQIRQYSISCDSNDRHYRISVQRETAPENDPTGAVGLVSNYLHDAIKEGDLLSIHMPFGDFVLSKGDSPVVLLSGGSGITAVLSMLEHLAGPQGGTRNVLFIHAARGRGRHAFNEHVRALAERRPGVRILVLYEEIGASDIAGLHHDEVGRISAEILRQYLPEHGAEFYYCGPLGFMAAMEAALDELHVPLEQRHSEAFGPDPSFAADAPVPAPQIGTNLN
jgi:nitric oxide dioxygenase